jgi:hypothetical protein
MKPSLMELNSPTTAVDSGGVVRAPGAHAREGLGKQLYLPKDAKARINRFAHQAGRLHEAAVRSKVFAKLIGMAEQGQGLPELLAEMEIMLGEPETNTTRGNS